jgi:hypothetical protein
MRESMGKYRGKRVGDGVWINGDLIHGIAKDLHIQNLNSKGYRAPVEVDPETVGQFTGLQDKDRKDIYEGDLWSWEGEVGSIFHKDANFNCSNDYDLQCMVDDLVITGNIHDEASA